MSSLWFDERGASWTACFTTLQGAGRRQLKKATGTGDRKLAQRIADELEEAAQGRRKREDIIAFLDSIGDLRCRRMTRKAFDGALRTATGAGLESKATGTFLRAWLDRTEHEVAPSTWVRYKQVANGFLDSLPSGRADGDLASITTEDCLRFRDREAKRVSPQTANVHLKILRIMLGSAEADGALVRNPARFVKSLKVRGENTRRPFTLAELKRVLEVADDEWRSLVLFGFYTGQRLADLASLTWQNVDLQRGELRLVTGKTGRRMILPLAKPLRDHLERLPAGDDPKAPLHPRTAGVVARQGRVGNLSNQFIDLLAQAGLVKARTHKAPKDGAGDGAGRKAKRHASELSFHSLRHSFVTALKATGAAEAVAMDLAGHDSAEISRHYTSLDADTKRTALDRLPVLA